MTTDIAPEVETPTLVTQEEAPPENPTPVGDAGEQSIADAAPETTQEAPATADYEAEADAYMRDLEGKESNAGATEAERTPEPQREVDPSQNFLEHRQNTRARHDKVDGFKAELLEWGIPEASVTRFLGEVKNLINEEHGDGIRLSGSSAAFAERWAIGQALQTLPESYIKQLNEKVKRPEGAPPPWADMLKTIREIAEAEGDAKGEKRGRRLGFIDGNRHHETKSSSANSGQRVQGDSVNGRSFANEDALHTAWNDKAISRDVYAREYKRLTGRDL